LNECGNGKLLDFGLANIADWRSDFVSQASWGSPPYMPPEQFLGLKNCTAASDLYSLGCTLYEMVTGQKPFQPSDGSEYERLHRLLAPPPFAETHPGIEQGQLHDNLWHVTSKLLAKDPGERYTSAEELLTDLSRAEAGENVETYRVTPGWVLELKKKLRRAAVAIAIVSVLAVAVFFGTRRFLVGQTPVIVEEAEQLFAQRRFAEVLAKAEELPDDLDPEHKGTVLGLKEQSVAAIRERTPLVDSFAQAEKARDEGRLGAAAELARETLAAAKAGDRFSGEEIARYSSLTSELTTGWEQFELRSAVGAREAGKYRSAHERLTRLVAGPELSASSRTQATAELRTTSLREQDAELKRSETLLGDGQLVAAESVLAQLMKVYPTLHTEHAERKSRLASNLVTARAAEQAKGLEEKQRAILERALTAIQSENLGAARAELQSLTPTATLAALASRRTAIQRLLEAGQADATGERLRLSGNHARSLEALRDALSALRVLPKPEADLAPLVDAATRRLEAREALVMAQTETAEARSASEWNAALQAATLAQELSVSSDDAARALAKELVARAKQGLAGASEGIRRQRYTAAIQEAREKLFPEDGKSLPRDAKGRVRRAPGAPQLAEALCREALANLPANETGGFQALAVAHEAAKTNDPDLARRTLLSGLAQLPRAHEAWRLLEIAVALRELGDEECLIPRLGTVSLGDAQAHNRNPRHQVTLPPFYIDQREATAADVLAFFDKGPPGIDRAAFDQAWAKRQIPPSAANEPIRLVTVAEAQAYARSLNPPRRLPTPEEWEVASSIASAGAVALAYPWGVEWAEGRQPALSVVPPGTGSNPADVSPWGCEDMGGDVSEWTFAKSKAVLKGGSFGVTDTPSAFLAVRRLTPQADRRSDWWGFRCARDVPAPDLNGLIEESGGGR
jgi:formylglycine-generating enzyme required for sulfatase activity